VVSLPRLCYSAAIEAWNLSQLAQNPCWLHAFAENLSDTTEMGNLRFLWAAGRNPKSPTLKLIWDGNVVFFQCIVSGPFRATLSAETVLSDCDLTRITWHWFRVQMLRNEEFSVCDSNERKIVESATTDELNSLSASHSREPSTFSSIEIPLTVGWDIISWHMSGQTWGLIGVWEKWRKNSKKVTFSLSVIEVHKRLQYNETQT